MDDLRDLFQKLRSDFPMLSKSQKGKPFVYLDSAATAHKPEIVIDTIADFYRNDYGTVHRAVYQTAAKSTERYQRVRKTVASFINAASESEIVFTRGTTSSLNLVAASLGKLLLTSGDEVLITEMEHHSNIVPWQMVCEERGAKLKVVPFDTTGTLDIEAFQSLLTPKTKICSFCHVSNVLGTINPIKEMSYLAHQVGAKVVVDGAQAVVHLPVDVQDFDVDFYAFSGHKIFGPTGIGILYGKNELLDLMPPFEGGGDMIEQVTFSKTTYNVAPLKFEAGTPSIAEVIGLGAALEYISQIGLARISCYEEKLSEHLHTQLRAIPGIRILGSAQKKTSLATFTIEGAHPLDIATMLDLNGIAIRSGHLCAQPVMRHFSCQTAARASLAFYNTYEDIDYFISSLRSTLPKLI